MLEEQQFDISRSSQYAAFMNKVFSLFDYKTADEALDKIKLLNDYAAYSSEMDKVTKSDLEILIEIKRLINRKDFHNNVCYDMHDFWTASLPFANDLSLGPEYTVFGKINGKIQKVNDKNGVVIVKKDKKLFIKDADIEVVGYVVGNNIVVYNDGCSLRFFDVNNVEPFCLDSEDLVDMVRVALREYGHNKSIEYDKKNNIVTLNEQTKTFKKFDQFLQEALQLKH